MSLVEEIKKLLAKEFWEELNSKIMFNSMLVFSILLIIIIIFPFSGISNLSLKIKNIIFWIIVYFASITGLTHSFLKEVDRGTDLLLKSYFRADAIIISKTLVNFIFLLTSLLIILIVYCKIFNFTVFYDFSILLIIVLTAIGLSFGGTLLSALIAEASQSSYLFAIIGFPVLFPIFLLAINLGEFFLTSGKLNTEKVFMVLLYDIIAFAASLLMFKFIWENE